MVATLSNFFSFPHTFHPSNTKLIIWTLMLAEEPRTSGTNKQSKHKSSGSLEIFLPIRQ
jgi:hypothetical protein